MWPVQIQSKLTRPFFKQTNNIKVLTKKKQLWNHNCSSTQTAAEINDITTNKIEINDKESESFFVENIFNKVFSVPN